jgi:hypothetical protein
MFHTYIRATTGTEIDFDRASFLMDRDLLQEAIDAIERERNVKPQPDLTERAQWVWDRYCKLHAKKYAQAFIPDVDPHWDQPSPPLGRMFRTDILTATGTVVNFDRASSLMDQDLLQEAINAMQHERDTNPRSDAVYDAQGVWGRYCDLHFEKYGEEFIPDSVEGWGQEAVTASETGPEQADDPEFDPKYMRVLRLPDQT